MPPFPATARAVIDLTRPPYSLDPSGQKDCAEGLTQALDDGLRQVRDAFLQLRESINSGERASAGFETRQGYGTLFPHDTPAARILYLPRGTYRLSGPVAHTVRPLENDFGMELNRQIRLMGEGRDLVQLKLDDHCPAFGEGVPRPVLSLISGERSNVAMSNFVRDLTIDTGRGNPDAIALEFFCNNNGALRNLRLRSGDPEGTGRAGLSVSRQLVSGALISDIEVEGFDYGIEVVAARIFTSFENILLRGQRRAGFHVADNPVSLRGLISDNTVPAVRISGALGHLVLLDSTLRGGDASGTAVDVRAGALFARDVRTEGYGTALREHGGNRIGPPFPAEYVWPPGMDALGGKNARSLRLPIMDTPDNPHAHSPDKWVAVNDFVALGDGETDDSPAIQRALDSGAAVLFFQPGRYRMDRAVTVPASVECVQFLFCDLVAGRPLRDSADIGAFRIEGASETPLFVENLFAWEDWYGLHTLIEHASRRTLVVRDVHTQTGAFYVNSVPGGRVFLENVSCTDPVGRRCARFRGQEVWARQFNPERADPEIRVEGGSLWLLGFKTEENGVQFEVTDGGRLEILGGTVNCHATAEANSRIDPATPILRVTDAEASMTAVTSGPDRPDASFGTVMEVHTTGEPARRIPAAWFPPRENRHIFIPLISCAGAKEETQPEPPGRRIF